MGVGCTGEAAPLLCSLSSSAVDDKVALNGAKPGVAAPIARVGVGGTNAWPFEARGVVTCPGDTNGVVATVSGRSMLVGAPGRTRPLLTAMALWSVLLWASSRTISSSISFEKRFRSTHLPRLTESKISALYWYECVQTTDFSDPHGRVILSTSRVRPRRVPHQNNSSLQA